MISTTNSATPQLQQQQHHFALSKRRKEDGGRGSFRIKKCPQHLLAYSIISILVFLCWLPDFIVALKDVSVTIPQAVKRGSNAMLTCNYDMENDTLYSVKWYKGRREFYRYTPKENPAMKVFPSQSGLNVERNLSNQSHVVLLAVPLNISGKFTCEISVEAPSFQTAMVSGEMEVVELPEEQASVTGIQPRYRIGDLVDGNCSIKYSKPAANLTWTINGIVVPPHHIKTYQIEKYEETNLESVMSAVHFMVTTQHFVKGQMRLKCTASIFDIFKEEIESIIEEDRPRIMASGQSYPPDHGYGNHGDSDGYEHNESYLTYFSAPKSSASRNAEFILAKMFKLLKQKLYENIQLLISLVNVKTRNALTTTLVNNNVKNTLDNINRIKIKTTFFFVYNIFHLILMKFIITSIVILLIVRSLQKIQQQEKYLTKCLNKKMIEDKRLAYNCIEKIRQMMMIRRTKKWNFLAMGLENKTLNKRDENGQQQRKRRREENEISYQDANNEECQAKCGLQQKTEQKQQQQQRNEHCLVANQNAVVVLKEKVLQRYTTNNTTQQNRNITTRPTTTLVIDCQHHMSQTFASDTIFTLKTPSLPAIFYPFYNSLPISFNSSLSAASSTTSSLSFSSLSLSTILGYRKTYAHDSFPLYNVDASKSNNAKYMSKDQTLLMTSVATVIVVAVAIVGATTSNSTYKTPSTHSTLPPLTTKVTATTSTAARALVLESKLLPTSVLPSLALSSATSPSLPTASTISRNNCLMAFIGELLLHQC